MVIIDAVVPVQVFAEIMRPLGIGEEVLALGRRVIIAIVQADRIGVGLGVIEIGIGERANINAITLRQRNAVFVGLDLLGPVKERREMVMFAVVDELRVDLIAALMAGEVPGACVLTCERNIG